MSDAARKLYEDQALALLQHEKYLVDILNGFREHVDRIHFVMATVKGLKPESVLDLACNIGVFGAMLRWNHGYAPKSVVGLDISPSNCEHAVRVMQYDRAINADVESWRPSADDRADLVLCMELLEHVAAPWVVTGVALMAAKQYVLFSVPVETGDPDGIYHVRKVSLEDLTGWIRSHNGQIAWSQFVASEFCEALHWKGWLFVLAKPGAEVKLWEN